MLALVQSEVFSFLEDCCFVPEYIFLLLVLLLYSLSLMSYFVFSLSGMENLKILMNDSLPVSIV